MFLSLMPDFNLAAGRYMTDQYSLLRKAQKDPYTMEHLRTGRFNWDHFLQANNLPTFELPDPNSPPRYYTPTSAKQTTNPQVIDYANAEIAKHYNMSKNTAYQEALANTSYQRSVKDMKAAGLNPSVLFGSGRVSGASSNIYPMESTGRSSARSYGRSAAAADDKNLFSSGMYNAIQTLGGLIGMAASKNSNGFYIGSQTAKGAMSFLDALIKA